MFRRDLVLEIGNVTVSVIGSLVIPFLRDRMLKVRSNPMIRLVLDTELQFAKWNDALQTAALWSLERFYVINDDISPLSYGRFSLIRSASVLPQRVRIGPCPAVYTPRLDHVFVPSATNIAFADGDRARKLRASTSEHGTFGTSFWAGNHPGTNDHQISPQTQHFPTAHSQRQPGTTSNNYSTNNSKSNLLGFGSTMDSIDADAVSVDTDIEPVSIAHVTAVTAGFGDMSTNEAAPDSAGPTRPRRSLGSSSRVGGVLAAAAARSALLRRTSGSYNRFRKSPSARYARDGGSAMGMGIGSKARMGLGHDEYGSNNDLEHSLLLNNHDTPSLRASLEGSEFNGSNKVVVKSIAREGFGKAIAASEALVAHAHLRHHGLVLILDVFETRNVLHVVCEKLEGMTLTKYLDTYGKLREHDAAKAIRIVLKAIGYMHAVGIVHWNLNADNITFENNSVDAPKLIDFSNARPMDSYTERIEAGNDANGNGYKKENVMFTARRPISAGDIAFASPEMLAAKAANYAPKTDSWQIGCLLYMMLMGHSPFESNTNNINTDGPVSMTTENSSIEKRASSAEAEGSHRYNYRRKLNNSNSNRGSRKRSRKSLVSHAIRTEIFDFCKMRANERYLYLFYRNGRRIRSTPYVSDNAKELVCQLLTPNPKMRPTALHCLQNSQFVRENNINGAQI